MLPIELSWLGFLSHLNVNRFLYEKPPPHKHTSSFQNPMTKNNAKIFQKFVEGVNYEELDAKDPETLTEEEKVALLGRPRLGDITKIQIRIRESKEFKVWHQTNWEFVWPLLCVMHLCSKPGLNRLCQKKTIPYPFVEWHLLRMFRHTRKISIQG